MSSNTKALPVVSNKDLSAADLFKIAPLGQILPNKATKPPLLSKGSFLVLITFVSWKDFKFSLIIFAIVFPSILKVLVFKKGAISFKKTFMPPA